MYYTIYKTTNTVNGKIYIGMHQTENLDDGYMGSGTLLKRALKKYGSQQFTKEILFVFDTFDEMRAREREIVDESFVARDDTYNLNVGGEGGWYRANQVYTREQRKMSLGLAHIALKNKIQIDPVYREKMRKHGQRLFRAWAVLGRPNVKSFLGRRHTDASKTQMSETHARNGLPIGEKNHRYGLHWMYNPDTLETKMLSDTEIHSVFYLNWEPGTRPDPPKQPKKILKGEEANGAKLTWAIVAEIRAQYAAGGVSQRKLAAQYGVAQPNIQGILTNRLWKT